jgi:hypothetical protein
VHLSYDGITFDILLLNDWDQVAVMSEDGVDFLYWHHKIDVTVILNPEVAVVFPTLQDGGSSSLKTREANLSTKLISRTRVAVNAGNISGGNWLQESPTSSQTIVNRQTIGPSSTPTPDTSSYTYSDLSGTVSEKAATGVPSFPPAKYIAPGIPYEDDLAEKTGPVRSSPGGEWQDPTTPAVVSPASINVKRALYYYDKNLKTPDSVLSTPGGFSVAGLGVVAKQGPVKRGPFRGGTAPSGYTSKRDRDTPEKGNVGPLVVPYIPVEPITNAVLEAAQALQGGLFSVPRTEQELRLRLQMPRRKLVIWLRGLGGPGAPDDIILNLPYNGCTTDAKFGPTCTEGAITALHGNVTGVKRLVFECHEALPIYSSAASNPGSRMSTQSAIPLIPPKIVLNVPPILSNRWSMAQIPDSATYLNSIVIKGTVVFRMDALSALHLTADQLRPYIMHPIAAGYVRRPPQVDIDSSGSVISYTLVDDQQMINNPEGAAWGVHTVVAQTDFTYESGQLSDKAIIQGMDWVRGTTTGN